MNDPTRFKSARQVADAEFVIHEPATQLPATQGGEEFYEEEPDVFSRIRAYCEGSEASSTLGIYRRVPNSRKEMFVANIDGSDFAPEVIKERFGGGDYTIKGYDSKSRLRLNQSLSIEGAPISEMRAASAHAMPPVSAPAALDIQSLMQMMQESNRQMLVGLAQIMQPAQGAESSRRDMLEEMRVMRDIFAQPQKSDEGGMNMLLKGIELAGSLGKGGDTSGMDVLLESIKSFAPAIGAVVAQSQARGPQVARQQQQAAPRALNAPGSIAAENHTEQPTEEQGDMMFKYYVGMLVGFAKEDRDPGLYADLIADNLPEAKIMEIATKPTMIDELIAINPEVANYRAWFEAVILELRTIMGLTDVPIADNVAPVITIPAQNDTAKNTDNQQH